MFVEVNGTDQCIHFINLNQICEIKKVEGSEICGIKTKFSLKFTNGKSIDVDLPEDDIHYLLKDNLIK